MWIHLVTQALNICGPAALCSFDIQRSDQVDPTNENWRRRDTQRKFSQGDNLFIHLTWAFLHILSLSLHFKQPDSASNTVIQSPLFWKT